MTESTKDLDRVKATASIQYKMFLRTAIMLAVTLVLMELVSFKMSSDQIQKLTQEQELRLAEGYVERLQNGFSSITADLDFLKSLPSLGEYHQNRAYQLIEESKQNRTSIAEFFEKLAARAPAYLGIRFIYKDGKGVVNLARGKREATDSTPPIFKTAEVAQKAAAEKTSVANGGLHHISSLGEDCLVLAVPLTASGDLFGHIEIYYSLDHLLGQLKKETLFETGYLSVVSQDGTAIYYPGEKVGANLSKRQPKIQNLLDTMKKSGKGNQRIELDKPYIVGYASVPEKQWYVVALVPEREILSVLIRIRNIVLFLGIACVLIEITASFAFLNTVVVKPLKRILHSTQEIIAGNLSTTVDVKSADELGVLGRTFNTMTRYLRDSRDQLEEYNRTLEKKVEDRTAALKEVQEAISEMLDNMQQAVLTFDADLKINEYRSKYVCTLFACEPPNDKDIIEFLFADSQVGSNDLAVCRNALKVSFDESEMQWSLSRGGLIKEFRKKVGDAEKDIKLTFEPIYDAAGNIRRVMVIMEDVTEFNRLQGVAKQKQEELMRLSELLSLDDALFNTFLTESSALMIQAAEQLAQLERCSRETYKPVVDDLFRTMHTLKGLARLTKLHAIQDNTHELEEFMDQVRAGAIPFSPEIVPELRERTQKVKAEIANYVSLRENVLRRKSTSKGEASGVKMRWLVSLLRQCANAMKNPYMEAHEVDLLLDSVDGALSALRKLSRDELVKSYDSMLQDIAKPKGKKIAAIEVSGNLQGFEPDLGREVNSMLIHCLRNSADHGLESPEERLSAGKSEAGTLRLRMNVSHGQAEIVIADDGKGIDPERLKSVALEKKLITPKQAAAMSEAEALELIFLPGFSTATTVSAVSGRGVGMDAVRATARKLGGDARIAAQKGQGTEVKITFPYQLARNVDRNIVFDLSYFVRHEVEKYQLLFKGAGVRLNASVPEGVACLAYGDRLAYEEAFGKCVRALLEQEPGAVTGIELSLLKDGDRGYKLAFSPVSGASGLKVLPAAPLVKRARDLLGANEAQLKLASSGAIEVLVPARLPKRFEQEKLHILVLSDEHERVASCFHRYLQEHLGHRAYHLYYPDQIGDFMSFKDSGRNLVFAEESYLSRQSIGELFAGGKAPDSFVLVSDHPDRFRISGELDKVPEDAVLLTGPTSQWCVTQAIELSLLKGETKTAPLERGAVENGSLRAAA